MSRIEVNNSHDLRTYTVRAGEAHVEFKIAKDEPVIVKWNTNGADHTRLIRELATKLPSISSFKPNAHLSFAEGTLGFNEVARAVGHSQSLLDKLLGRQRIPLDAVTKFATRNKNKK